METVYIDAESYGEESVRVKDGGIGTYAYVTHPSTRPILWAVHHESVGSLVFENPNLFEIIEQLRIDWKLSKPIQLVHWGAFDRLLLQYSLQFPIFEDDPPWLYTLDPRLPGRCYFRDLREESLTYGAPGKLEDAAPFWAGLKKDEAGLALLKKFTIPNKGKRIHPEDAPVEWEQFRSYARQDVAVLPPIDAAIQMIAANGGHDPAEHWPGSSMVRRMNDRGVGVDRKSVQISRSLMVVEQTHAIERCQELCSLNPTQLQKLKKVLGLPNMQAETVEAFLLTTDDPVKREIAELQQSVAGAAVKKLEVMNRMALEDDRVRGCFQYHGAHTRRLTSMDLQLHNFVREPYDPDFFVKVRDLNGEPFMGLKGVIFKQIRANIRGFLMALQGRGFVAADYKAIECRVINWLAGEDWVLELFRQGGDPYKHLAVAIFQIAMEYIDDKRRQVGKIGELALGFGGGKGAVKQSGRSYGLDIPDDFGEHMKVTYRETHPNVVQLWRKCERAFRMAIDGNTVTVNGKIRFERYQHFVKVIRPSGFAQYFWQPRIVQGEWDDGSPREEIAYVGRARSGRMVLMRTYGGDIAQGVTQGIAADLMLEGMIRVEAAGILPVMSVHDEGVFEVNPDEWEGDLVRHVCDLMTVQPSWADGLPIDAEGWMGPRFTKA